MKKLALVLAGLVLFAAVALAADFLSRRIGFSHDDCCFAIRLRTDLLRALRTLRTRDTSGISLWMYVVFTFGIACWFGYGLFLQSWPMIVSNAITFVLSATILGLKLKHG